jgi:thiol-disulfide isomerase/thioredoxin
VPALNLPTLDGSDRGIDADAGSLVIVHFFATWCEPCRDELRSLQRLATRFEGPAFRILAVDVGEPADRVRRFLERNDINLRFPVLVDFDKQAMRAWDVEMLPTSYVLDRTLCPLWKASGALEWDSGPIVRQLEVEVGKPEPVAMSNSKELCIVKGGD